MQPANKSTSTLGVAFIFMSLAIVPFSLKAAGLEIGISLPSAADAFRQISGLVASGYAPASDFVWAQPAENGDKAAEDGDCPLMAAAQPNDEISLAQEIVPDCPGLVVEKMSIATCPKAQARSKRNRAGSPAAGATIVLPIRARVLADVLRLHPMVTPAVASAPGCPQTLRRRGAVDVNEIIRRMTFEKDQNNVLKFRFDNSFAGTRTARPAPRPPAKTA